MKIWTLLENTSCREDLQAEHGLSFYIETGSHKILFDMGQSDAFACNARKMGIDLSCADMAVLSHGHYDHGGGMWNFLLENSTAPIYVNQNAFESHYNGTEKNIGLDPALRQCERLVMTPDVWYLDEGMELYTCNDRPARYSINSCGLCIKENGNFCPDDFRHEQYLLIEEKGKKILFSGCSHKGILNIVNWFQPDVLIGGFHFKKLDPFGADASILRQTAEILMQYPTKYYTCHCTGSAQYRFLKQIMGHRLSYLSTGSVLTIPEGEMGNTDSYIQCL